MREVTVKALLQNNLTNELNNKSLESFEKIELLRAIPYSCKINDLDLVLSTCQTDCSSDKGKLWLVNRALETARAGYIEEAIALLSKTKDSNDNPTTIGDDEDIIRLKAQLVDYLEMIKIHSTCTTNDESMQIIPKSPTKFLDNNSHRLSLKDRSALLNTLMMPKHEQVSRLDSSLSQRLSDEGKITLKEHFESLKDEPEQLQMQIGRILELLVIRRELPSLSLSDYRDLQKYKDFESIDSLDEMESLCIDQLDQLSKL